MITPFYDLLGTIQEGDFVDGGWIPPEQRPQVMSSAHEMIMSDMPSFDIIGPQADVEKLVLWDFSKAVNGGSHFKTFYQQTGSCVGNAGGQAVWYLSAMEIVRTQQNISPKIPFYLLPYGRSRALAGIRGQGDGSMGSSFAKAMLQDGILPFDHADLPPVSTTNGITWGKKVEYKWSDGAAISETFLTQSRNYIVKSAANCRSTNDVWAALANGYPCTIASNWGGQMRPAAQGSPSILLNKRVTSWQHQMCIIGIWKHPQFGRIFCVLNSWGQDAHGVPPDGSPPGSFWIAENDMDFIVRQGETFAFSQFVGFPSQRPNYWLI